MKDLKTKDIKGLNLLLRTDLNLPLQNDDPQKTLRFERYIETLSELMEREAKTVVLAHQGRPARDDFMSLKKHKALIEEELECEVFFVNSFMGDELQETLAKMVNGDIALMENVRMMSEELKEIPAEKHGEGLYINHVAKHFDLFVNDAFSVSHRSHASIVGLPQLLESFPGPVMDEELETCQKIRDEFDSGVLVLGGEKTSDLIGIIKSEIDSVDKILLGGIPGELALITQGYNLGEKQSWIKENEFGLGKEELKDLIESYPDKFELPTDLRTSNGNKSIEEIDGKTWDIGKETADRYAQIIRDADKVLMKGPMGEFENYPKGTKQILQALKTCQGFTVMGGGHTSSLVEEFGYDLQDFDHVSIAGGAFVEFISKGELSGVNVLKPDF